MMTTRPKTPGRVLGPSDARLSNAGRPRKDPPAGAAELIRHAAAHGASQRGVAMALHSNVDCLRRWLDEHPELKQAFDEGREQERAVLHNALYRTATEGTGKDALIAAMFLLKSRHGYVEGDQEVQTNRVAVTFNIPAALPLDKFMVVDDGGTSTTERLPAKIARGS
ncbi:hypothetical protein JJB11_22150 [Ramlibacter ginsenosidimutans]|uniref:Terminase small subunit n=1 Tax=Ramlibacter ginsenosidimutans TaxID=502333 RepID=A0A934WPU3_9BURK|nr:hypothetical protein [Ramlibacter ginsenosidimutans]MBK6008808.1 hypothetical protein [Ramlibacter ginsenosidimutans]